MPKLIFVEHDGTEHEVDATAGQSIMDAAINEMVPGVLAECGGACACATCHVRIDAPWAELLPAMDAMEEGMLGGAIDPDDASRLSCQISISEAMDGMRIRLPEHQI